MHLPTKYNINITRLKLLIKETFKELIKEIRKEEEKIKTILGT